MATASYVIGLGSNRPHGRHGPPARVLAAAIAAMRAEGIAIVTVSPILRTSAMGPSDRDYANAAVLAHSILAPLALLALLKRIERDFGRRRGRRWGARVLDLDILLWSKGVWRSAALTVPHPGLSLRGFALDPASAVAPRWRPPPLALTLRQHAARRRRPQPVDRRRPAS